MISTLTAYDILTNALEYNGAISFGEFIDPNMAKQALQMLNGLRAEWSGKYINYKKYDKTYTTSENKQFISLGSSTTVSGDILERPASIEEVVIMFGTNNYQIPVKSYEEYRQLTIQNIYNLPAAAYLDTEYPLQNVYLYPGLASGYSIRIMGHSYLPEYENVSDSYIDPPEMFQCLALALALKTAPKFGTDPNSLVNVQQMLNSALKPLKATNFKNGMHRAKNDLFGSSGSMNFFSGV